MQHPGLLNHFFDVAALVADPFRLLAVLTVDDYLETSDRHRQAGVIAWDISEYVSNQEWL
ncbi:MAG: hypothetical protein HY940_02640 [Gammaproteobacteria bacterium]|nr:hypothetical protein [Gammaproteobacteria bacterium]